MGVLDLPADAPARPPKPYLPPFRELPDTPALQELKRRQQFVVWNYQWKQGKWTKPPATVRGEGNRWADPAQWGTYEEAAEVARRSPGYGVGYVLGRDDNLTGADLDDCRDPVTGALEPWAADILSLAETYAEISPSGKGVRLFWRGKVEQATSCKPAGVEIYCGGRYLTITGNHVPGTPTEIRPAPQTERILLARAAEFLA